MVGERRVNEERREEKRESIEERERGKAVNESPQMFLTFNR